MPSLEVLIAFTLAAFVMNLSPGPSNLYVMARSIAQGAGAGCVAAGGLALGSLGHVAAAAFGLAALLAYSPVAFTALKLVGAAYLIWLGIGHFRNRPEAPIADAPAHSGPRRRSRRILIESIVVELTNPKSALFFLALLPQFTAPEAGPLVPQLLVLGMIVTLSAVPCDLAVAFASGRAARWLASSPQAQRIQQWLSGSILLGLGAWVVTDEVRR